jgi:hypothetical protein
MRNVQTGYSPSLYFMSEVEQLQQLARPQELHGRAPVFTVAPEIRPHPREIAVAFLLPHGGSSENSY